MDLQIMRDARVRSVQWRDLTRLTKLEVVAELVMPIPLTHLCPYAMLPPNWKRIAFCGNHSRHSSIVTRHDKLAREGV